MHQYNFEYNEHRAEVKRTKKTVSIWGGFTNMLSTTVDDMKKAPLRRQALKAIADSALTPIYNDIAQEKRDRQAERNTAKQTKQASKEAAKVTKLEEVVNNAQATT